MFLFTDRAPSAPRPSLNDGVPHAAPMRQASEATGVSFDYLAKTAERESRFNPAARAPTSTAAGMFQFLEQTWLGMVKQEGPKVGLANEANAISADGGRFTVGDGAMRQKILALREDPGVSALMAGAFAAKNGKLLEESIGRKPTEGELYIAHFLGAAGAKDLIALAKSSPDAPAASAFRDAASANRPVFYDGSGRARSAGEVYANLTGAFSRNPVLQLQETAAATDRAHAMFRAKEGGKPLHGLFRSNGEPVASAISETWIGRSKRSVTDQQEGTRVAFFPREIAKNMAVASDAPEASPLQVEGSRRAVTIPLPESRPAGLTADQAAKLENRAASRSRTVARLGQPLDLMSFVKASITQ